MRSTANVRREREADDAPAELFQQGDRTLVRFGGVEGEPKFYFVSLKVRAGIVTATGDTQRQESNA